MADLSRWTSVHTGRFHFNPKLRGQDVEAVREEFLERLQGIRERLLASDLPLPPREEMSIAERLATASTKEEWEEAIRETHECLARERGPGW